MNESSVESLVLGARGWLWPAIVVSIAIAALAVWSYLNAHRLSGLRFLTMALKILAVVALAFCLVEPMRRIERPRPGANLMALVMDDSRSMGMKPPGAEDSRLGLLKPNLVNESPWQLRLAQDFEVRRYGFSERLRAVDSLSDLNFDGNYSSLGQALGQLRDRFSSRPVAGLMLFTDGLATDDLTDLLANPPGFPVYPVVSAKQTDMRDLAIASTSVVMSSFELSPATIDANLVATGLQGKEVVVRLLDTRGETLESKSVLCDSDDYVRRVRFQYRPGTEGEDAAGRFHLVEIRAMLKEEDREEFDKPLQEMVSPTELTLANNSRVVGIDPGKGPFRLLYVAGRPNWEFKFLRRALSEDPELELNALIRIARKEPKFSFREQGVETANPLMAGFSDDGDTEEQYDEPVLKPIGKDESLQAGFPSGQEDLFKYHAIILDDVEAEFFTQQQMQLMREFVTLRGGGLMMLGGQESFLGGDYAETPLADLLPVYLRGKELVSKDNSVRYQLTREGQLEPWLRLRESQQMERMRVQEMPEFFTWNVVRDTKPGAAILASFETGEGVAPALVTQRFGKGRTLALLVGDFWRWSMRRATEENDDLAQSWRQIARWVTGDVPRRIAVEVQEPDGPTEPHRIEVQLRNAKYQMLDNAQVSIVVTEPDGSEIVATAKVDERRPGTYVAEYWSKLDGGYQCVVEVRDDPSEESLTLETGWTAQPSAREFQRVVPDLSLLQQVAEASGGKTVQLDDLEGFVKTLPSQKVPVTESHVEPLWHRAWLMLFAIGCLVIEWTIRRWKGLP